MWRRKTLTIFIGGEGADGDCWNGRFVSEPRNSQPKPPPRTNACEAEGTSEIDARFVDVSRQAFGWIRRGNGCGSDRASRRTTPGRVRARSLLGRTPEDCHYHYPHLRVQREVRYSPCRTIPPQQP